MTILFNDFEARSRASIKKVGARRYARDPSTRALMLAYAFDNDDVQQWVPAEGQKMPRDLRDALRDPKVIKRSWNAQMEIAMWEAVYGEEIDYNAWECTMVHAYCLSLPGSLEAAGEVVDLPEDKKKSTRGKYLIRKFCIPRTPTKTKPWEWNSHITDPEDWDEFKDYNVQDVVAERAIYRHIRKWPVPNHEWDMWVLDQEINKDGIPINMKVVEKAISFTEFIRDKRYARIKELTGVENPRSNPQLLEWLWDNGYKFDDLKKGHVERAAQDPTTNRWDVKEVLALRAEVAKTSPDKFYAMERAVDPDKDVIQGCLQFGGAQRTLRWSGRVIQPQNLSRPHADLEKVQPECVRHMETMSNETLEMLYDRTPGNFKAVGAIDFIATCVRPTIQAPKGHMMVSADLNAIENRVLGYLSGDQKILDVFRNDRDPYVDFASYMFHQPYDVLMAEVVAGDKSKRTIAKPGVLGCGYMLSAGEEHENEKTGEMEATGLLGYAWNMGVKLTAEQAEESVKVWRRTFEDAVAYWWKIDKAAKRCVRTGMETDAGPVWFDRSGPFMRMHLPSGRSLHYCRPQLSETELFWCHEKRKYLPYHMCKQPDRDDTKFKESITYEGMNDKNKWVRIHTHPGKWTENADQAIARDILAESMRRFRRRVSRDVARLVLHVHDEPVAIAKEREAERVLKIMEECLKEPMPWATEKELPLGAKGSIGQCWVKD